MEHECLIIDYAILGETACHIKVIVYDAESGLQSEGEVRFLNGLIYGDFLHPSRSLLSPECRENTRSYLTAKYKAGGFS